MAAKIRRVGYARLALAGIVLAPLSWAMITKAQEPEARPVPAATTADAIRREIETQRDRHEERIAELQALRDRIAKETTDEAKADVEKLDAVIARERQDHTARLALLRDLLAADPGAPRVREGDVEREWNDLAAGVRRLNQSYVVAPVVSDFAASGGSYYIDRDDRAVEPRRIEPRAVEPRAGEAPADEPRVDEGRVVRPRMVRLPPPLYVGRDGVRTLPRWLYGVPDGYYPADVQPRILARDEEEVVRLRQAVRELSREVEELRQRTTPTP